MDICYEDNLCTSYVPLELVGCVYLQARVWVLIHAKENFDYNTIELLLQIKMYVGTFF